MPAPKISPPSFYLPGKKGEPKPVPGAIAWYRCDEGSGQILYDYSGNGNHGTLGSQPTGVDTNDPAWNEKGLVFGGDDYADCGNPVALQNMNPYTVICVFNISAGVTGSQAVVSKTNSTSPIGLGFSILWDYVAKTLRLTHYDAGGPGSIRNAEISFTPDSMWHYAVGIYDGMGITLQLDGGKSTKVNCGYSPAPTRNLVIGKLSYTAAYWLVGGVGPVAIFPFALTDTQNTQERAYIQAYLAPKGVILP